MVKVGGEGRERMMMPAGGAAASYCPALLGEARLGRGGGRGGGTGGGGGQVVEGYQGGEGMNVGL